MTNWKPKPGEDAVVRVVEVHGDTAYVGGMRPIWTDDLRPLPVATLSADDAAVLAAAKAWADLWQDDAHLMERGIRKEVHRLLAAVRARAAGKVEGKKVADRDGERQIVAAMEAVVEAAAVMVADYGPPNGGVGRPYWLLYDAFIALNALLTPTPPDPVASLAALVEQQIAECGPTHLTPKIRAALAALGAKP